MEPELEEVAQDELARLEPHIDTAFSRLRDTVVSGSRDPELAHQVFRDAVLAAGWLLASGGDESAAGRDLPDFLDIAAVSALFVLEAGSAVSTVERFTLREYVAAFYAALASGREETVTRFADWAPADCGVRSLPDEPWIAAIADGLRAMVKNAPVPASFESACQAAERAFEDAAINVWRAQLDCLRQLFAADAIGFDVALSKLSDAIVEIYVGEEHEYNPHAYLPLPLLGLKALAVQTGVIGVEPSDLD